MLVAGGGLECYNAHAVVDTEAMLVPFPQVVQAANDKQQLAPMLERRAALREDLPEPEQRTADAGYFSEGNVSAREEACIEPSIAIKRDEHHPQGSERFERTAALPTEAIPVERMTHRLKTPAGRATYALRKQTVERVFCIIKSVMGFPQFLTRGLDNL